MKIAILSDTHGNHSLIAEITEALDDADYIVHLGDEIDDAFLIEDITGKDVLKVRGNCDFSTAYPHEATLELAGRRIFLTHGDFYSVKAGLDRLMKKAAMEKADVVMYGHTHMASVQKLNGTLFINPGSLKRGCTSPSYAVLTLEDGAMSAEIIHVDVTAV